MKYVIAYSYKKLSFGTSPSVSNYNVKHIKIDLRSKIKIQGVLDSPFRDPLPILIAILTGCYILTINIILSHTFMEFVGTAKFSELHGVKHKLLQLIFISHLYSSSNSAPRN